MIIEHDDYFFLKVNSIDYQASGDTVNPYFFTFNEVPLCELLDDKIECFIDIKVLKKSIKKEGVFPLLICPCLEPGCGLTKVRVVHGERVIHWFIDDYPVKPLKISFSKKLLKNFVKKFK